MEIELGEEILSALTTLAKYSKRAGLSNISEALDDALILAFNGLCADRRARKPMTIGDTPIGCERMH